MGFDVSNTMKVIFEEEKKIDYFVIKIGDKTYSSSYEDIKKGLIKGKLQVVETKGIGEQTQLWVKGNITEGKNHEKLKEEVPIEVNIYFNNEGK